MAPISAHIERSVAGVSSCRVPARRWGRLRSTAGTAITRRHQALRLTRIHAAVGAVDEADAVDDSPLSEGDIDFYTPGQAIAYNTEPQYMCPYDLDVTVNADVTSCFNAWNDWKRLPEFMDLIGQVGLDDETPHLALLQFFYRWQTLPILEMPCVVSKTNVVPNEKICFESLYGLPVEGEVVFSAKPDGTTAINLSLIHAMPLQLVDNVGKFAVHSNLQHILAENLVAFKSMMEDEGFAATAAAGVVPSEDSWFPQPDVTDGAAMVDKWIEFMNDSEAQGEAEEEGQVQGEESDQS